MSANLPEHDPDWHGEKAKRERQRTIRAASERAFVLGMAATALLIVIGIIVAVRIQIVPIVPVRSDRPIVIAPPYDVQTLYFYGTSAVATAQEANRLLGLTQTAAHIAQVDTMGAAAETATAMPSPTLTPVPTLPAVVPTVSESSRLFEYVYNAGSFASNGLPSLAQVRALPVLPMAGYSFGGAQVGPEGHLYVTHTRDQDIAACDPNEAYWIIDTQSGQKIDQIADPSLISPKQIAFDSAGNAYVLATDCKWRVHAVFKFDTHRHWIDTFPIVGGDDLTITSDDRILVALSGFADNSIPQPHLIELRSDPTTGKLFQEATLKIGADPDGRYRSILIVNTNTQPRRPDFLYLVWTTYSAFDQLQSIGLAPNLTLENVRDSALQTGPIRDNLGAVQVDNLAMIGSGMVVGLTLDHHSAVQFQNPNGQVITFPIPGLNVASFAIDPTTQHWFIAGQPDAANAPGAKALG
ncbi:MAG: NHL repeat-containing protein [Aggregatilineales bacterium]